MRPEQLNTSIFLDSGDPAETQEALAVLGFLDGQTTNPSLIAKKYHSQNNPDAQRLSTQELLDFYKKTVQEISALLPNGSISIEVYADSTTPSDTMLSQAREMYTWIPKARIKFPTNHEGLKAARAAVSEGMRINMTLVFQLEQSAAVYSATAGAQKGQVYISPFIGRLDDQGDNGMDLVKNIIQLYKKGDGHVKTLTASVRTLNHLLYAIKLGSDIVTAPLKLLKEWNQSGLLMPNGDFTYNSAQLKPLEYTAFDLNAHWQSFQIDHPLLTAGIDKFAADWNKLLGRQV